jgi:hypothetical protein
MKHVFSERMGRRKYSLRALWTGCLDILAEHKTLLCPSLSFLIINTAMMEYER